MSAGTGAVDGRAAPMAGRVRRAARDGERRPARRDAGARVDALTYGVLTIFFVALVLLEKIALPLGSGFVEVSLPTVYTGLIFLAWRKRLTLNLERMGLFLIFTTFAVVSSLLSQTNFSVGSLLLVLVLYAPYALDLRISPETYLKGMRFFTNVMVFAAVLALAEQLIQVTLGARAWPSMDNLLPKSILLPQFVYLQPIRYGSPLMKPNAFFFLEVSFLAQFLALALMVEFLYFGRVWRLILFGLSILLTFAGTGLLLVLVCAPLVIPQLNRRTLLIMGGVALLTLLLALQLGWYDLISHRFTEYQRADSSSSHRFVAPVLELARVMRSRNILITGEGAGSIQETLDFTWWPAAKLMVEYGLLTTVAFFVYLGVSVFRQAPNIRLAVVVLVFFNFLGGGLATPVYALTPLLFCGLMHVPPRRRSGWAAAIAAARRGGAAVRAGAGRAAAAFGPPVMARATAFAAADRALAGPSGWSAANVPAPRALERRGAHAPVVARETAARSGSRSRPSQIAAPPRQARLFGRLRFYAWVFALFMMANPFFLQLAGINPSSFAAQGFKPYQFYLQVLVSAAASVTLVGKGTQIFRIAVNAWPLTSLIAFIFLSSIWSADPYLGARTAASSLLVLVVAAGLVLDLGRERALKAALTAMGMAVLLSVVWVFVFPVYGKHQAVDLYQQSHVGKWRGIYNHKNLLGQVSGTVLPLFACFGSRLLGRRAALLFGGCAALCLAMSQSASGLVVASAGIGLYFVSYVFKGQLRAMAAGVGVVLALTVIFLGEDIVVGISHVLGRSATFSGRTYLWDEGLKLIAERPVGGYGVSAFSNAQIKQAFQAVFGTGLEDPHNAYLFFTIAVGGVGLVLLLISLMNGMWRAVSPRGAIREEYGRRFCVVLIACWMIAGLVESQPLTPGGALAAYGYFALIWLAGLDLPSVRTASAGRRGSTSVASSDRSAISAPTAADVSRRRTSQSVRS